MSRERSQLDGPHTFLVPYTLLRTGLPTSPRVICRRAGLPRREGEIEQMVQVLSGSHLGYTLRGGRLGHKVARH